MRYVAMGLRELCTSLALLKRRIACILQSYIAQRGMEFVEVSSVELQAGYMHSA